MLWILYNWIKSMGKKQWIEASHYLSGGLLQGRDLGKISHKAYVLSKAKHLVTETS